MKIRVAICFMLICCMLSINVFADTDGRQIVKVPVLMYHCVNEDVNNLTITEENFKKHLDVIRDNGFTPILPEDMIAYVDEGKELPSKPVCITFDDGYLDNYSNAYPMLKEYNFKAVFFVIGSSVGKSTYKDTFYPIRPHYGYDEAVEMVQSGLISIQSHTYDMHQAKEFESSQNVRENLMPFAGENLRTYLMALENDILINKTLLENGVGQPVIATAYPIGKYNGFVELVMKKNGIRVTVATSPGTNYLVKNDANSLYSLNRYNISDDVSPEQLLEWLNEE